MSALHYTETGEGEALILLHSGGMAGEEWKPQIPAFAKRFRVIVPDQLGHGQSPMRGDKFAIGDIGRAVIELMDELNLDKASLVGSSMGGAVALWLTVNHPQRVDKLGSVDISSRIHVKSMSYRFVVLLVRLLKSMGCSKCQQNLVVCHF